MRVMHRSFKVRDLVLRKLLPARKDPAHGNLGPNWEGPYIISRVVRLGNYELQTKEGKVMPHSWNAEHLKRFFLVNFCKKDFFNKITSFNLAQ